MLTSLIRTKTMLSLLLTYVLGFVLVDLVWLFRMDFATASSELLSTHWAFGWVDGSYSIISILGVVLLTGAATFSRIRFREIKETLGSRNLSMLVFVSLVASQSQIVFGRPDVLIGNLVIIAVFMLIFFTYKKDNALSEIFHVGLGIGVASLFVGQSIVLVLAVAFSLLMLRTGNLKEWVVFSLGLMMTMVFIWLAVIWADAPVLAFKRVIQSAWMAQVSVTSLTVGHVVLFSIMVLSLSTALSNITAGTVHLRNISLVNLGWVIGVALMILILGVDWQAGLVLAAFPLSNLVAQFIESINRWWLADILVLLLLSAPVLSILLPL